MVGQGGCPLGDGPRVGGGQRGLRVCVALSLHPSGHPAPAPAPTRLQPGHGAAREGVHGGARARRLGHGTHARLLLTVALATAGLMLAAAAASEGGTTRHGELLFLLFFLVFVFFRCHCSGPGPCFLSQSSLFNHQLLSRLCFSSYYYYSLLVSILFLMFSPSRSTVDILFLLFYAKFSSFTSIQKPLLPLYEAREDRGMTGRGALEV